MAEDDLTWIIDAMLDYVNGKDFKDKIGEFMRQNCFAFCDKGTNEDSKTKIYQTYINFYDTLMEKLLKDLGMSKEKIRNAWDVIITSEEGFSDAKLSAEFMACEHFNIFSLFIQFYHALEKIKRLSPEEKANKAIVTQLNGEREMLELKMALELSTVVEEKMKAKKSGLDNVGSSSSLSSSPSSSSSSKESDDVSEKSEKQVKHFQITPLTTDVMYNNVTKLRQMEDELSKRLAALREEQERKVREEGGDLAAKMRAKREAAMRANASANKKKK